MTIKRTEIYFDKSRYMYLSAYSKDLANRANELAGTLKRRDFLHVPIDMQLLHDLLNGGTLVLSALRSHLQEQKDSLPLLSRSGAENQIETLTDEAGAMIAEFSRKAYIGNDRQPVTDRMQCIKVDAETFVYDDEKCNVIFPSATEYSVRESTARFVYCIQQAQRLYDVVFEAVAQTYGEEFADHIMKTFDGKYFDMQRVLESWMHESIIENLCTLDKHNVI